MDGSLKLNRLKIDTISFARAGCFWGFKSSVFLPVTLVVLFVLQGCLNHKFYQPDQIVYETPARYNLAYTDVFFNSRDGTRLHGWFLPAAGNAVGTVIHFHGNYGNLTYYLKQVSWLPSKNFNVFTFDYRGYGRSAGAPSRRGLYEDSISALEYLRSRPEVDRKNIYVFGQSLGGANAVAALAAGGFADIRALALEGKQDERECLKCHTTAMGLPGGFPADGQTREHPDLASVGCESCHGPGGDHIGEKAKRIGTIVSLGDKCDSCVILKVCGTCHDDANDPDFEFQVEQRIEAQRHGTIESAATRAGLSAFHEHRSPRATRAAPLAWATHEDARDRALLRHALGHAAPPSRTTPPSDEQG